MPQYRERFQLTAPAKFVDEAVHECFEASWIFLSQEPGRVVVEEKIRSGKELYHPITFIGAAHIEVIIRSLSEGVEVICNARNRYYGNGAGQDTHGHAHAQREIESQVKTLKTQLKQKVKSWSAQQQYQVVQYTGGGNGMNIWRLIPFHERPRAEEFAEWSRRSGAIAIGWGLMGDLRQHHFRDEAELKRLVADTHLGFSTNSWVNGGRSLWRLYHNMQIGDLVIISASGARKLTVRVTGDYYFVKLGDDPSHYYEHRRKVEVETIDPDRLWHLSGRMAPGEGVYTTLIRCAHALTDAEYQQIGGKGAVE